MSVDAPELVYIEDNEDEVYVFRRSLQRIDRKAVTLQHYGDASVALEELTARGAHELPKLVLLDLSLPGLDGRGFLEQWAQIPHLAALPVVVWSSSDQPGDVRFCLEHGARAYHVKPFGLHELDRDLSLVLSYWLDTVEVPK